MFKYTFDTAIKIFVTQQQEMADLQIEVQETTWKSLNFRFNTMQKLARDYRKASRKNERYKALICHEYQHSY